MGLHLSTSSKFADTVLIEGILLSLKILSLLKRDSWLGVFYRTRVLENSQENTCTAPFFKNNFIEQNSLFWRKIKNKLNVSRT